MTDLVVLCADKDIEAALSELLRSRCKALDIRDVKFTVLVHPEHDPGCYRRSHDFLRPMNRQYDHAVVVFDREGCGREDHREIIESNVEGRLAANGWDQRARCVVIEPELESWLWARPPHLARLLNWQIGTPISDWLRAEALWSEVDPKPSRPKEALEAVLRRVNRPRSSALYSELAATADLTQCADGAFQKLTALLKEWFPPAD